MLRIFLFLVIFPFGSIAQSYLEVDSTVTKEFPRKSRKPDEIGFLVRKYFENDSSKARAIYFWIASNIKYDYKLLKKIENNQIKSLKIKSKNLTDYNNKLKKYNSKLARKTIKKRKGVCGGYSALFNQIALNAGLETKIETGLAKNSLELIGKFPSKKYNHAWNSCKIGSNWRPIDVTWGSGYLKDNKHFEFDFSDAFFMPKYEKFNLLHFQDTKNKLARFNFTNLPIFHRTYMKSEIEVACPTKGVLLFNRKNPFMEIELKNIKESDFIMYSIGHQTCIYQAQVDFNENYATVLLNYLSNKNEVLTIWVNGNAIVSYKVVLK